MTLSSIRAEHCYPLSSAFCPHAFLIIAMGYIMFYQYGKMYTTVDWLYSSGLKTQAQCRLEGGKDEAQRKNYRYSGRSRL
jgi:hypothetical protein